jgi:tRNA A-37 threonylcarbamoyl transferase component Bud32
MDKSLLDRIDEICDEFEASLRNGERPSIERQLDLIPAEAKRLLFAELSHLEVQYHLKAGEECSPSDYLQRFGDFQAEIERAFGGKQQGADDRTLAPHAAASALAENATLAPPQGMTLSENQTADQLECFGDYQIIKEIARGGMGVVYKARQVNLNRVVALKMILAGRFAGTEEIQRFRAEAEAVAGLDHPHVVPVYEVGEQQGHHYFSMKFIEGGNLSSQVDELRADPRRAMRLMSKVVSAINHAHQRGILHRDLKPANILVDNEGEPHVTDFGLARRAGADSDLTNTGAILGTPRYMPPEQAAGKKDLTTAADIYSLGAILYELLTGRPPFSAETALDTILLVIDGELVAPSKINRQVDRELELIALKCLEKSPESRYGSTDALLSDLNAWLAGEPISLRPPGITTYLSLWLAQNVRIVAWTAVIGGLSGLITGLLWWLGSLQTGIGEQAIVYQYLKSARQPWLAIDWRPPVWLAGLAIPLTIVPMIVAPFLSVVVTRPKTRTADIATGAILALMFAIAFYSISGGWGPVISSIYGSEQNDINLLAEAAWEYPEATANARGPESDLLQTYPELRGMSASQRSRAMVAKIFCDQATAIPFGLLIGMFVTLMGSLGPGILGACIAGSMYRRYGTWSRAVLPYGELAGALTMLVALMAIYLLGPLSGLDIDVIWWRFWLLLGAIAAMIVAAVLGWKWRIRIALALASAGALAFFLSGGQSMTQKMAAAKFRTALGHVELGGIANAAPFFAEAADLQAEDHYLWYVRATVHLRIGEPSKYRSDCAEIMRRFGPIEHPIIAERTAKLLLLRPSHGKDLETAVHLVDQASKSDKESPYFNWVELVQGIAAFRTGDFDAAVTTLSILENLESQPFAAMSGLFLAMAQHQTGDASAAEETFRRATKSIDNPHRSTSGWLDWLMCEIVRAEAEKLLP